MRTYQQYKEARTIAATLVEYGIPSEVFVESIANVIERDGQLDETALYNELLRNILGGISNLARGAAGVGNMVGSMAGSAGRAVGNAAMAGGRAVGNAAAAGGRALGNAASAAGQGIANAGRAVGGAAADAGRAVGGAVKSGAQAVGNAASTAGNYMGDLYQQGKQRETLKQALNAVQGLQDQLGAAGIDPNEIQKALAPLQQIVNTHLTNVNADKGYRVGGAGAAPAAATGTTGTP